MPRRPSVHGAVLARSTYDAVCTEQCLHATSLDLHDEDLSPIA